MVFVTRPDVATGEEAWAWYLSQDLTWRLEKKLGHRICHAAWRSDSISEPSSAALGLTSQNLGKKVR